mmetsp:Transcript_69931/g.166955  ORF Transcript_69931/g.166955 Transcript_69931/m.166955 type:complete len:340 (-) Transcript_69931:783-1802(-)
MQKLRRQSNPPVKRLLLLQRLAAEERQVKDVMLRRLFMIMGQSCCELPIDLAAGFRDHAQLLADQVSSLWKWERHAEPGDGRNFSTDGCHIHIPRFRMPLLDHQCQRISRVLIGLPYQHKPQAGKSLLELLLHSLGKDFVAIDLHHVVQASDQEDIAISILGANVPGPVPARAVCVCEEYPLVHLFCRRPPIALKHGRPCQTNLALDAMTNWAKVLVEETQAQVLGRLAYRARLWGSNRICTHQLRCLCHPIRDHDLCVEEVAHLVHELLWKAAAAVSDESHTMRRALQHLLPLLLDDLLVHLRHSRVPGDTLLQDNVPVICRIELREDDGTGTGEGGQ